MPGFEPLDNHGGLPAGGNAPALIPTGAFAGQPTVLLARACVVIGSDSAADLRLPGDFIRPIHALVVTTTSGVYIRNLSGQSDMLINGLPLVEYFLNDADDIQVGQLTCKFAVNGVRFQPRSAPLALALEIPGAGALPVHGRVALLGRAAHCDIRIADAADYHAILFAADGGWHCRDLGSPAGTSVNGQTQRESPLQGGDLLTVGVTQMRILVAAQPAPESFDSATDIGGGFAPFGPGPMEDLYLGGMPVALPEAGPPSSFGKVGVTFDVKSMTPPPRAAPPVAPQPPIAQPANPPTPTPIPASPDVHKVQSAPSAAPTTAAPKKNLPPPPPKRKPAPPASEEPIEEPQADEAPTAPVDVFAMPAHDVFSDSFAGDQFETNGFDDARFGGQTSLTPSEEFIPASGESPEQFRVEIEDFAENKFWDMTDDLDLPVPLRAAEKDLSPLIPPIAAGETPQSPPLRQPAARPAGSNGAAARPQPAPSAPPRPVSPPSGKTADYQPGRYRSRARFRSIAATLGVSAMAASAAAIWLGLPTHAIVEGRLAFSHIPPLTTPAWTAFEADQRQRLADPSITPAAIKNFQSDHPDTSPRWLAPDSPLLAQIIRDARFDSTGTTSSDLVLRAAGTDGYGDSQRLSAILKAIYQKDSDQAAAAQAAQVSLAAWLPNIAAKQLEIDQTTQQMQEQQALIDAGQVAAAQAGPLLAAANEAGRKCAAAELAVQAKQDRLALLQAQLASTKSATRPSTLPADSGDFVSFNGPLADIQSQIAQVSEQIRSFQGLADDSKVPALEQYRSAYEQRMDRQLLAATKTFRERPELLEAITSAGELQAQVRQEITSLTQRRRDVAEQYENLQRRIDQLSRLNHEIHDQADPHHTASSHLRPSGLPQESHLVSRVEKLIDGAKAQFQEQVQLIDVSLQTLQARLGAVGIPSDLAPNAQSLLQEIAQTAASTAQLQHEYSLGISQEEPYAASVVWLKERLSTLNTRLQARKQILDAAAVTDTDARRKIEAEVDDVSAQLKTDLAAMDAAEADFSTQALAGTETALKIQASRRARQALTTLQEAADSKRVDMTALKSNSEDLQKAVDATISLKSPSEADSRIVSDDTNRKLLYIVADLVVIGGLTAATMKKARG